MDVGKLQEKSTKKAQVKAHRGTLKDKGSLYMTWVKSRSLFEQENSHSANDLPRERF